MRSPRTTAPACRQPLSEQPGDKHVGVQVEHRPLIRLRRDRNALPFVKTEQDLTEGLDYLAGSVRASLQMAWSYRPERPFLVNSTNQFTKMGLDNPDTVYYHANVRPDATYVVPAPSSAKANSGVEPPGIGQAGRQPMQSVQPHWGPDAAR